MGTTRNPLAGRYFNDSGMAQGMSNLAAAFAPPSAEEYLAAEKYKTARTQASAIQDLYAQSGGDFDKLGIVSDLFDPTSSFEAVRTKDATDRYGIDVGANTSRTNNTADNARALAVGQLGVQGDVVGQMLDPAGRNAVDPEFMSAIFGPGSSGGTAARPVAPTETQVAGGILDGMTPEQQRAIVGSDVDLAQVVDPVTGLPKNATELDAIGQQPYINPGSQATPDAITFNRNGVRMGGFVRSGQFVDSAGAPLSAEEAGTATKLGSPTGTNAELGLTNANITDANRLKQSVAQSNLLITDLETLINSQSGAAGLPGTIKMLAQDFRQVGQELTASFGEDMNAIIPSDVLNAISDPGAGYDPTYRKIRSGLLQLAYLNAQRDNPRGEVSRFALERQIEALSGGMMGNDQSFLASLSMSKEANARALAGMDAANGTGVPPTAAPAGDPLAEARAAIAAGADPNAVRQRLQENGIDPGGL